MVIYRGAQLTQNLPRAVSAALTVAASLKQALSIVRQTKYYASLAMKQKKAIERELAQTFQSNTKSAPVAIGKQISLNGPRYRSGNVDGMMLVTHREYLGEIAGSTTFGAVSYPINPGLGSSFPWLAGIANSYEKYRIRRMSYEFVNIAATSERGRVTLAVDYDVLDAVPSNKVDLFQISGASEGPIWEPLTLQVKPSPLLYTRNGSLSGVDLKTYDAGRFIAAVSNAADTSIKGELFVTYEIELHIPQAAKCPGSQINGVVASWAGAAPFTGCALTGPLAGVTVTANTISFERPSAYLVAVYISGTGTIGSPTITPNGCTSAAYGTSPGGISAFYQVVSTSIPGASLTYSWSASLTSTTVVVSIAYFNNYLQ